VLTFAQIFVVIFVLLTTFVVILAYICILPAKMSHSLSWTVYHLIVGHWLLVNIVFHYFKAAFINPGQVPEVCVSGICLCFYCIIFYLVIFLAVFTF